MHSAPAQSATTTAAWPATAAASKAVSGWRPNLLSTWQSSLRRRASSAAAAALPAKARSKARAISALPRLAQHNKGVSLAPRASPKVGSAPALSKAAAASWRSALVAPNRGVSSTVGTPSSEDGGGGASETSLPEPEPPDLCLSSLRSGEEGLLSATTGRGGPSGLAPRATKASTMSARPALAAASKAVTALPDASLATKSAGSLPRLNASRASSTRAGLAARASSNCTASRRLSRASMSGSRSVFRSVVATLYRRSNQASPASLVRKSSNRLLSFPPLKLDTAKTKGRDGCGALSTLVPRWICISLL